MSSITTFLSRPSSLGLLAICSSGAFYVGLKSKTLLAKRAQKRSGDISEGENGADEKDKNYEVSTARSGGGV